jgi:transcriptional regulator with XRE-family HTH domain
MSATETKAIESWLREKIGYVPLPRLKRARLSKGVGLRELARRANLAIGTISRIERGYAAQSRVAVRLAETLDVNILALMAPAKLSDEDIEEFARVLAGEPLRAYGRGDEDDEEDGLGEL